jgi:hypothetical protein
MSAVSFCSVPAGSPCCSGLESCDLVEPSVVAGFGSPAGAAVSVSPSVVAAAMPSPLMIAAPTPAAIAPACSQRTTRSVSRAPRPRALLLDLRCAAATTNPLFPGANPPRSVDPDAPIRPLDPESTTWISDIHRQ